MNVEDDRQQPILLPSRPCVVVVDNNVATIAFTCSMLAMASIAAEGCPNNARTLAYIRHKRPDVVLLTSPLADDPDCHMFTALHSDPATETIRIVFVTGDAEQLRKKITVYDSSMVQFLMSPYALDALIRTIASADTGKGSIA